MQPSDRDTNDGCDIIVLEYNEETREYTEINMISVRTVAKNMTPDNLAVLLDNYSNNTLFSPSRDGYALGERLCRVHRYLQGQLIEFLLQTLRVLSQQEYTDPRNEVMIKFAKQATDRIAYASHNKDGLFFKERTSPCPTE